MSCNYRMMVSCTTVWTHTHFGKIQFPLVQCKREKWLNANSPFKGSDAAFSRESAYKQGLFITYYTDQRANRYEIPGKAWKMSVHCIACLTQMPSNQSYHMLITRIYVMSMIAGRCYIENDSLFANKYDIIMKNGTSGRELLNCAFVQHNTYQNLNEQR